MLDTEFSWYRSEDANQEVLRTLAYSVPDEVKDHINFVQPTTRFGSLTPLSSTAQIIDAGTKSDGTLKWWGGSAPQVNITCNLTITPECILDLYNAHYKADPKNGNTVGYASFLEEYARYADLAQFVKVYAPYATGENVSYPFLFIGPSLKYHSSQFCNSMVVLMTKSAQKVLEKPIWITNTS